MKKVLITVQKNQNISGLLIAPKKLKNNPAILFIHGWASSKKNYIDRSMPLVEKGWVSLVFDLRGHGESFGKLEDFSRKDHLEDVIAAFDYLASLPFVDKDKIAVCGSSYGGYLATLLSSNRKFKYLCLRAPALYSDDDFDVPTAAIVKNETTQVFRRTDLSINQSETLKSLSKFSGEVLLIEAEKDQIIPKATINNFLKALNPERTTHTIIKGANHQLSDPTWNNQFVTLLTNWLIPTP
jgi:dipeptidyl aminopeptidase/acylaminoacyl peptidase